MENFYFIGVDISKKKLDFCVMFEGKVVHEEETANHQNAIMSLIRHLEKDYGIDGSRMLICAEHTGQYTFPLACACKAAECKLWLENPAEIKYSSGIQRGKNDKVDAKRIAVYASRFQDKVQYYERPSEDIERLKQLESERSLYVTDLAKYKGQLKDQREYMPTALYERKVKRLTALMENLEQAIQAITNEMDEVITSCPVLFRQIKFNCYAGVAPFSYSSGTSQQSKARVSHRADKVMKRLLHMAAIAVTHRNGGELKRYYDRKVAEGKNKMSVINALRAKIVARMFAVIKRNELYKPILS